jgi:hypothetical protein
MKQHRRESDNRESYGQTPSKSDPDSLECQQEGRPFAS